MFTASAASRTPITCPMTGFSGNADHAREIGAGRRQQDEQDHLEPNRRPIRAASLPPRAVARQNRAGRGVMMGPGQRPEDAMDQRIINLYDRFTRGGMTRRDFLDRLSELAGSAAAAAALLPLLQNDYAQAAIIAADDA